MILNDFKRTKFSFKKSVEGIGMMLASRHQREARVRGNLVILILLKLAFYKCIYDFNCICTECTFLGIKILTRLCKVLYIIKFLSYYTRIIAQFSSFEVITVSFREEVRIVFMLNPAFECFRCIQQASLEYLVEK